MKSSNPRTRAWRLRTYGLGLLIVALAVVVGVGIAGAKKHHPKAKLNISVPPTVADGSSWTLTVKGKSGKFNMVGSDAHFGTGCPAASLIASGFGNKSVTKYHKFTTSFQYTAANPGTHTACAYLWIGDDSSGQSKVKSTTYTVTP